MNDLNKIECESLAGLWVNLAFYSESDRAGARTSVSSYKSRMISYILLILFAKLLYFLLYINFNQ